jgi:dTDP-4-dehydrorhamnose reductase
MDKQRLLIIGARGFLGEHAAHAATGAFEVIRGGRSGTGESGGVVLDVADSNRVNRVFDDVRPDMVLLLAAMSDIDQCERFPAQAFEVNVRGAENVANASARVRARLAFTSSAAVFDGKKHGYSEEDPVSPLSTYGVTKTRAEEVVRALTPSAVIVRIALVLGLAQNDSTNAMLNRLIQKWKAGEEVTFPTHELRNPIDVVSLSETLLGLLANPRFSGVYHVGASDSISRYELAKRLARRVGVSADLVIRQDQPTPGRAPRGADHFLLTTKVSRDCNLTVPTTDEVIERCLS